MRWCGFIGLLCVYQIMAQPPELSYHSDFEKTAFLSQNNLEMLLAINPGINETIFAEYKAHFESICSRILKKEVANIQDLEDLFYSVHQRQLKHYKSYSDLSLIFAANTYNCVSGTALFALILDSLHISYQIYEFTNHVILVGEWKHQRFMIESTDPYDGFTVGEQPIRERFGQIQEEQQAELGTFMMNVISLRELAALQYMNQGIRCFTSGDASQARKHLQKAKFLYPSIRIKELHEFFSEKDRLVSSK